MSELVVLRHRTAQHLADTVAARFLVAVADAQARRGTADVVLTGGSMGTAFLSSLAQLCESPLAASVDWDQVHAWWGDERFVPRGDTERNDHALRSTPLRHVHPVPGPDEAADAAVAARFYAAQLTERGLEESEPHGIPSFDLVMLGIGPDGHCASLFPGYPQLSVTDATCVAVHDSPKPPPTRVTLTVPVLRSAAQVWFLAAGRDKADAVSRAIQGRPGVPAAMIKGRRRTLWLLDDDAGHGC